MTPQLAAQILELLQKPLFSFRLTFTGGAMAESPAQPDIGLAADIADAAGYGATITGQQAVLEKPPAVFTPSAQLPAGVIQPESAVIVEHAPPYTAHALAAVLNRTESGLAPALEKLLQAGKIRRQPNGFTAI